MGAEIVSQVVEQGFDYLDSPVLRVCGKDTPIPFSPILERFALPQVEDIVNAARRLAGIEEQI
jgi:pyruvate/2-oxoglutarate/acetoin dehydrogenase E1 component